MVTFDALLLVTSRYISPFIVSWFIHSLNHPKLMETDESIILELKLNCLTKIEIQSDGRYKFQTSYFVYSGTFYCY